jgi:exopolyphosphatase/guanosine-5'-triphosphate,3'-diphosphate pyrophosphatase
LDDAADFMKPHPSDGVGLHGKPIGIVDIGSNTVRLVVYDGLRRTPLPLFNEKATCALGQTLESTGALNPQGVPLALDAVARFVGLARAMEVQRLDVLATAAARDATDGPAFIGEIERRTGVAVTLLSGEDEARRAAYGVLCSTTDADGMVCDLGGGSLELVMVEAMRCGAFATLPLGVLRLAGHSGGDHVKAATQIDRHLDGVDFLDQARGRHLYAVGGSWRALARVLIAQMNYPLHVLDNFTLPTAQARDLIAFIGRQSPKSLEKVPGVSKRRLAHLPLSAQLLSRLLERTAPDHMVFSVYGMREGQFYLSLPKTLQDGDPLISAATQAAHQAGRFPEHASELMDWMQPLFPDEPQRLARLRLAACLLGDIFWSEHPDYRAEQAFLRVLRLPFMGLDHHDRAALALSVFFRYAGDDSLPMARQAMAMLPEERVIRVRAIGAALRLGHSVSGGAPGLLRRTRLDRGETVLVLGVPADDPTFLPAAFDKRLEKLAAELGLTPQVVAV